MNQATARPALDDILLEARQFHLAFASLLLATASADGEPTASYAPYVTDAEGSFYVYVSELAAHTANLQQHPRASVLFIEDESHARHLFGRRRVTYSCRVEGISRQDARFAGILDRFAEKHGKFMDMMRDLQDFHLFRLVPERASYVRGFAEAFELTGERLEQIRHLNDKGHRAGSRDTASQMNTLSAA